MPLPRPTTPILLSACLLAGCATTHRTQDLTCGAAPALVAWLCADVCRIVFPQADPVPYHAGAPVTVVAPSHYEIRYERRADGRWAVRADGRLTNVGFDAAGRWHLPRYTQESGLNGLIRPAGWIRVVVSATKDRTRIELEHRAVDARGLARHLHAALAALDCGIGEPTATGVTARSCCGRHADLQAVPLYRRALGRRQRGDLQGARDDLRAVLALAPEPTWIHRLVGYLDQRLGHDQQAADHLISAARLSGDLAARQQLAHQARISRLRSQSHATGIQLRDDARRHLAAGDLAAAEALAREARSRDGDPIADLKLRHELQVARGQQGDALATAVLLREHAALPEVDAMLARGFAATGQTFLAARTESRRILQELPGTKLREGDGKTPWLAAVLGRLLQPSGGLARPPR